MKLHLYFAVILCVGLVSHVRSETDDDDDDDGVEIEVEDEVQYEKPKYKQPELKGNAFFAEPFNKKWVVSEARKDGAEESIAKYDGKWKTKAKHHAVSAKLDKPFDFSGKPFIVQYDVRFQNGIDCGGAYVKLLSEEKRLDLKNFHDKTPYTVMFGPDKCGMDHKLHFIFRHRNPKTGTIEEKHAKKPSGSLDSYFSDKKTHLYTLSNPPVNPPKEIDDPNDKKPADWDEREKIQDPDATKPDDWDESQPEKIRDPDATKPEGWLDDEAELTPDPDAEKPSDWDDDMDGEWEAPLVNNPKCKEAPGCGKWEAPMISNPAYKGKWKPPMIDNPNYKNALGLELWSMNDDIVFDNFIITDDRAVAEAWAADTWLIKSESEKAKAKASSRSVVDAVLDVTKGRPWLWAVFLVVVVLPIVLIIAYCCMSSSKQEFLDAQAKKTDEQSPDDESKSKTSDEKSDKDGAGGDSPDEPEDEDEEESSPAEAKTSDSPR
ncbi:hypothetical protein KUTeg_023943 [Tegillarca granosa]|uniref:Calnexin n=1 Tax=Tegillarca granosa TaxID=220873 RepID=A0ABQ9DWK9_TEGGR|nr:hypothetical protein KUTeg_023943 [Tegillarca granosa]